MARNYPTLKSTNERIDEVNKRIDLTIHSIRAVQIDLETKAVAERKWRRFQRGMDIAFLAVLILIVLT